MDKIISFIELRAVKLRKHLSTAMRTNRPDTEIISIRYRLKEVNAILKRIKSDKFDDYYAHYCEELKLDKNADKT